MVLRNRGAFPLPEMSIRWERISGIGIDALCTYTYNLYVYVYVTCIPKKCILYIYGKSWLIHTVYSIYSYIYGMAASPRKELMHRRIQNAQSTWVTHEWDQNFVSYIYYMYVYIYIYHKITCLNRLNLKHKVEFLLTDWCFAVPVCVFRCFCPLLSDVGYPHLNTHRTSSFQIFLCPVLGW